MARKNKPKYQEDLIEQVEEPFIKFQKVKLTPKQKIVQELINNNKITVLTGVAGTSKSFIAVYSALKLLGDDYHRIIITKALETVGESQGWLPGTIEDKMQPFMDSFEDIYEDILEPGVSQQMISSKEIQYKASQYIRGRTLKKSIVIVDEFQSVELPILIALVTRMGKNNCKFIFCGDIKQNDIDKKYVAVNIFKQILYELPGVALFQFAPEDNMRDPLVQMIVQRYEQLESEGLLTPNRKNT